MGGGGGQCNQEPAREWLSWVNKGGPACDPPTGANSSNNATVALAQETTRFVLCVFNQSADQNGPSRLNPPGQGRITRQ